MPQDTNPLEVIDRLGTRFKAPLEAAKIEQLQQEFRDILEHASQYLLSATKKYGGGYFMLMVHLSGQIY